MIKFSVSESMLNADSVFLTYTIKGQPGQKRQLIKKTNINKMKNKIVRDEVRTMLTNLANQREKTFIHSGYAVDEKSIKALNSIKRQLPELDSIYDMQQFFGKVIRMSFNFETIQPSDHSRYINWKPQFEAIFQFALKCHEYYTGAQVDDNAQLSMYQEHKSINALNPVGAGT